MYEKCSKCISKSDSDKMEFQLYSVVPSMLQGKKYPDHDLPTFFFFLVPR